MNYLKQKKNKGFVILIATLLASLFALLGASIFSLTIKELKLSSGGKESQEAFYSADSGIECALYWDINGIDIFATSLTSSPEPDTLYCNDQDVTANSDWVWKGPLTTSTQGETDFSFRMFPGDPVRRDCVKVIVIKSSATTTIESRGYNSCVDDSPRRVERGLKIIY